MDGDDTPILQDPITTSRGNFPTRPREIFSWVRNVSIGRSTTWGYNWLRMCSTLVSAFIVNLLPTYFPRHIAAIVSILFKQSSFGDFLTPSCPSVQRNPVHFRLIDGAFCQDSRLHVLNLSPLLCLSPARVCTQSGRFRLHQK